MLLSCESWLFWIIYNSLNIPLPIQCLALNQIMMVYNFIRMSAYLGLWDVFQSQMGLPLQKQQQNKAPNTNIITWSQLSPKKPGGQPSSQNSPSMPGGHLQLPVTWSHLPPFLQRHGLLQSLPYVPWGDIDNEHEEITLGIGLGNEHEETTLGIGLHNEHETTLSVWLDNEHEITLAIGLESDMNVWWIIRLGQLTQSPSATVGQDGLARHAISPILHLLMAINRA